MSSGYIEFPLSSDADDLAVEALQYLQENIPGWVPREGHLEVWMVEVWARMVAEARIVAGQVPLEIFRYFGQSLVGVEPIEASRATAVTTWTAIDSAGYTIPAGTVVAFRVAGDELVPFEVVQDRVIPPGQTVASNVQISAVQEGSRPSGLGPEDLELIDALSFVDTLTANAASSGGVDAEPMEDYLDRLRAELRLLAPRPILPQDFAVAARRVAGVHRALAINLFDPETGTYDNERTVTVAVVDVDGLPLGQEVKDDVISILDAQREVNFIVHVIDPDYTSVDVSVEVKLRLDEDPALVEESIELALNQVIGPATWAGGNLSPPVWQPGSGVVRYLEIAALVLGVPGVEYIIDLKLDGATQDVVLFGDAPLPEIGTLSVTAVV